MAIAAKPYTLESVLSQVLRALEGKNRSRATIQAYQTDLNQFLAWLRETNITIERPEDSKLCALTLDDIDLAPRTVPHCLWPGQRCYD